MNKKLIKDNFYEAVNGQWIEKAVIPDDQASMSAFLELHLGIEETLLGLTSQWSANPNALNNHLKNYIKYYHMTKNFEKRAELSTLPIKPYMDLIENLKNLKDFEANLKDLILTSLDTPFGFFVAQDFNNSSQQVLYFGSTGLFLPDKSYYLDENSKQQLLGLFQATTTELLLLYGYSPEAANTLLEEAIAFDALLVPVTKSSVEAADYTKLYNPVAREEVIALTKNVNIMTVADALVNDNIDNLIVTNLEFLNAFDEIINEENFSIMKSWMIVQNLINLSPLLTDEIRIAGGAFNRALSGVKEAQSKEKFAFYQAYNQFSQAVGLYYGENFFGPEAKKDVSSMVHEMIEVYQERIKNNSWLQEQTKAKAIKKLDTMSVLVGYPDELPPYYDQYQINGYEEGSNVAEQSLRMKQAELKYQYRQYKQRPNKNIWGMPASMVNAYFNPTNNQIVFPAAILQKPYYSLEQSSSANYGGIGAVIAHEISHAFDNSGAKFDETGSLNNWWSEEDLQAFENKAEEMVTLFDGVETGFGPCNGRLTVSENIADSSGIRAAYEASLKSGTHDNDEFFTNWARVWRQKASPEYAQLLLNVDTHGPAILRANLQLSNLPEFQEHYEINEGDEMYLAKEKMVSIW